MSELRTLLPFFRPYRRGLAGGIALVVITNIFSTIAPYLVKLAIDETEAATPSMDRIITFAALIVLTAILGGLAKFGMRNVLNGISRRIEVDLRDKFFRHLLTLDATFYGATRTGDLMARATNDTLAVRMAAGPAIMYAVNTVVSFALALTLMVWISPRLTLYALVPLLILPPVVFGFAKIIHQRYEVIQDQFSDLTTMIQENLTGVRIVRAYTQEEPQAAQFDAMNRLYMDRNMGLVKVAGLFHPILGLVSGSTMVIVLWLGGLEVIAGNISIGDFVAFGIYLALLIWPMIAMGFVVNIFQRGAASMARINRILQTEPGVANPPSATEVAWKGRVEFRSVSFRYPGTERMVLRDISFVVEPGETVAIVGATGSGKSTMISLIPRLYDATEGEILLDGVPVRDVDLHALREVTGFVPLDTFLFSTSIAENIAFGLGSPEKAWAAGVVPELGKDHDELLSGLSPGASHEPSEIVYDAAKTAQLDESIRSFPRAYRTILGERGINLSGGQKQRATLARAVARDPIFLILDDALSAVDTHTEAQILAELQRTMEGRTSFVISHRVSAVMNADQILVLDDGRIVERGTHTELMELAGSYAGLLRRQMLEQDLASEVVSSGD